MVRDEIDKIEQRLDKEYCEPIPKHLSWETAASYLLLAHAEGTNAPGLAGTQAGVANEHAKFGIMHAIRFINALESRPRPGFPDVCREALREWAHTLLQRATDFDAVCSVFTYLRAGDLSIRHLDDTRLTVEPVDESDSAFDAADILYSSEIPVDPTHFVADVLRLVSRLHSTADLERPDAKLIGELRELLPGAREQLEPSFQLPATWDYRGSPINDLRWVWSSVFLLAQLHQALVWSRKTNGSWSHLLRVPSAQLEHTVVAVAGRPPELVRHLLAIQTYARSANKPDIALTPFINASTGGVIASPQLITSSSAERNFYVTLTQTDRASVDNRSGLLEPAMARELAEACDQRGFYTRSGVHFTSRLGAGDFDLLIWSPDENFLIALELKWFVAPGDYREVINRNASASSSLAKQLPKYRAALEDGAVDALSRAFGRSNRDPVEYSTGLVLRNHVGRASLPRQPSWFAPERVFRDALRSSASLRRIARRMSTFSWLPRAGRDYERLTEEVRSPSGFKLQISGIRLLHPSD